MDETAQLNILIALADSLGIEVRHAALGGAGGGLCTVRGRVVLFVDTDADTITRVEHAARGLARFPGIETIFVRPDVRELLDRFGE